MAGNESVEELHLAENADMGQEIMSELVETATGTFEANVESNELEIADSEDETVREEPPILSGPDASCASSCKKNSHVHQLIQDLCEAIVSAKKLKLLDLSRNRFSKEAIDLIYAAWSSSRSNLKSCKHVKKDTLHFSVDGTKCCGVKPCCRKD